MKNLIKDRKTKCLYKATKNRFWLGLVLLLITTLSLSVLFVNIVEPQYHNQSVPSPRPLVDCTLTEGQDVVEVTQPEPVVYDKVMYTTTSVNLRLQPSVDSESVMIVPSYEIVIAHIENIEDEWYSVSYNIEDDRSGYIKSEYLREYRAGEYVNIPLEYYNQDLVRDLIDLYGLDIDEYFIYGMMYCESRFNKDEVSSVGANGIMQIMPSTWKLLYEDFCSDYPDYADTIKNDPMDKRSNITLGVYYISRIKYSYGIDSVSEYSSKVLTTYNKGVAGTKSFYNKNGTYSSAYSKEVLRVAEYIRTYNTCEEI